jgi:hypothetical protein
MRKMYLAIAAGVLVATGLGATGEATAVTPPSTITGVISKAKTSVSNSAIAKGVTVTCPSGKSVINASGSISGGSGKVVLDGLFPDSALTSVTVNGKETDPTTANWTVKAKATCADTPSGLEWNYLPSANNSTSPKTAAAGCSAGKTMLGTGMDIVGGQGEVGAYSIIPEIDAAGRAIDVEVNAAEIDPLATSWEVHAFAICADDVYPQQVIYADHSVTSDGSAGLTVYCPFGTVATGTGYDVPDAVGEIIVNSIDPGGSKTTATDRTSITAFEEDGTFLTETPRAYAICANR